MIHMQSPQEVLKSSWAYMLRRPIGGLAIGVRLCEGGRCPSQSRCWCLGPVLVSWRFSGMSRATAAFSIRWRPRASLRFGLAGFRQSSLSRQNGSRYGSFM